MSNKNAQTSIPALILTLFPIPPRALSEQIYDEIRKKIQEIWKSTERKVKFQIREQKFNKNNQDVRFSSNFYNNLHSKLETLKEARKNHFRTGSVTPHWWPTTDDIYLGNRVPANLHSFCIRDKTILFSIKDTTPEETVEYSLKKKFYFLSQTPIEQTGSLIRIYFQFRPLKEKEKDKFGKQPKQKLINKITLKTLRELFNTLTIQENIVSALLETLEFHLFLFTLRNDPIILHKNLSDHYTNVIGKFLRNDPKVIPQINLGLKKGNLMNDVPFRQIEAKFFQDIVALLFSYEEFLASVWSKKSFVTQTEYIISLNKLSEWIGKDFNDKIIGEILSNKNQLKEWASLYQTDLIAIKAQLKSSNQENSLPLDTRHFNADFKWRLLSALPEVPIHDLLDGYVYRSDNWYALNSLKSMWQGKIKCIYIDPPYNTGNEDFIYKDNYSRFQWMVMLRNRLEVAKTYLSEDGVIIISINDNEMANLKLLLDEIFENNSIGPIIVQTNPRGRTLDMHLAKTHEYLLIYALNKDQSTTLFKIPKNEDQLAEYNKIDEKGRKYRLIELRNRNPRFNRKNRPNLYYPLYTNVTLNQISVKKSEEFPIEILPKTSRNLDDCWTWSKEKTLANLDLLVSKRVTTGAWRVFRRSYLDDRGESSTTKEKSIWMERSLSNERGREQLRDLFGRHIHDYPKSVDYIERIIQLATKDKHVVMDFFAGSGTTAQAVMRVNQEKRTTIKFILIEKSNQFKNVILPRIKKLSYSQQWKNGAPLDKTGQSVFIQYQELEQPMEEVFPKANLARILPKTSLKYSISNLKLQFDVPIFVMPFNLISNSEIMNIRKINEIDIVYTCNLLLGLNPSSIRFMKCNDIDYLIIIGSNNEQRISIIWRKSDNLNEKDDLDILTNIVSDMECDQIYVNNPPKGEKYNSNKSIFDLIKSNVSE
ncbi:MAG: site-specific DNA-methyltransferase [Candidatus Hodarchaeales archaeon]|jgi:adenine-specific DNA-methyltransferase